MSYYDVLSVAKDASMKDIKHAFKNLVSQYGGDGSTESPEMMKKLHEVSKAFSVLGNPEKRMEYDLKLSNQKSNNKITENKNNYDLYPSFYHGFGSLNNYISQQLIAMQNMQNHMQSMMKDIEKDFSNDTNNISFDIKDNNNHKYSKVFSSATYVDNNGVRESRVIKKINNNGVVSGKEIVQKGKDKYTKIYHPDGKVSTYPNSQLQLNNNIILTNNEHDIQKHQT